MLAKRLDLWRLANFELRRLRSAEDVYVFHAVAHDNPADHRLFALAEVRDLNPARAAGGAVRYPRLELMGLLALSAMQEALTTFEGRNRPAANRIVLYVRPPWDVPRDAWDELAAVVGTAGGRRRTGEGGAARALSRRSRRCARRGGVRRGRDGTRTPTGPAADPAIDGVPTETVARQPLRRPLPVRDRADAYPSGRGRITVSRRAVHRARPGRAREPGAGVATVRDEQRQHCGRPAAQRHRKGAGRHDPGGAIRRSDPRTGQPGRAGVPTHHRSAGPGRADAGTGRVVRAVVWGKDRNGQRHREHGLDCCGAAPPHRVHPSRRGGEHSLSPG